MTVTGWKDVLAAGLACVQTQKAVGALQELLDAHDAAHILFRCAGDEQTRYDIGLEHDKLVEMLEALGYAHPAPPSDGLDLVVETELKSDDSTESGETTATAKRDKLYEIPICKVDEERRIVYGVVLEPDVVDHQGEWETAEVIEAAAHSFLARYNAATEIGVQHEMFNVSGVELVESFIAPQDLDLDGLLEGDDIIRKGSWVMAVHITDDDLWQQVKDGGITGFSIGGTATVLAEVA